MQGFAKSWLFDVARVALLLAFAWVAVCIDVVAAPRSLRFERLGVEQGLSQESIHTLRQDRDGYIWIGTQAGLNRYDGYKVKVFRNDPADPASLVDNFVRASYEDREGRLWFGTKGGLTRFDSATQGFVRYPMPATMLQRNQLVLAIEGAPDGTLWLGTADGLKQLDPASGRYRSWRHDPLDPGSLADDRINALARDAQGNLWIGTADGLDKLAPGASSFLHYRSATLPDERKRNQVVALSMGPRATLWVGTAAGLESWRIDSAAPQRHRYGAADGIGSGRIAALYHDSGANLWVGTDSEGLKWRDPATGQFLTYARQALDRHSLSDAQVTSILVDRTGTLWAGTVWGGVNRSDLASGGFNRINHNPDIKDGLPSDKVRNITGADGSRLWIGTSGGGLARIDPRSGRGQLFQHDDDQPGSLPDNIVSGLVRDGSRLWVGSPSGLSWREDGRNDGRNVFHALSLGADANTNYVQDMTLGRDRTLWIITRAGLHALAPDRSTLRTWRHDPHENNSLGENYGFTVLEDRAGMLWIGTDTGLDRFDPVRGVFTHFHHDPRDPSSLMHSRVYDLYQAANGAIWAGTAGGLSRVDVAPDGAVRFRNFALTSDRAPGPVGAILEDGTGMLWLSTTVGLTRLDPVSGRVKNYSARDGLIDGSYFVGAGWRAADGTLYFGGVNGMTSFQPADIRDNPFPPKVVLTDFSVANRPRALDPGPGPARLTLAPRDTVFSIEFAALHYADPGGNLYAYRLHGFDPDWVRTDASRRFASYTNLDPGNYRFEVKAANKDGVWSSEPVTLAVTVTPPLWKTWWLRTLVVLLLVTLGVLAYHLRIRSLLQQKTRLEREVNTRTGELVKQKESAEARKREVEQQKEVVEQAHRNISLLSEIGRDLTANLHSETIMATLYNHVNELMDASVFGIGVYRPERGEIDMPFAMERGMRYRPYVRKMAEPNQLAVWCIEQRREVFINDLQQQYGDYIENLELTDGRGRVGCLEDGTLPATPHSLMYVPIMAGARVLGVITVHSYVNNAYQRIHLDMLRTLAAYVGVAFDNADAYRRLTETRSQLVAHEKLAALGSLVAGVAHELNTPIGNSLLLASTMQHQTERVAAVFDAGTLRRSELVGFMGSAREGTELIMRSLQQAADLVNSFKQVAVDQASAQRRQFDLAQASVEIVATMMNQVRLGGHTLELALPAGIHMDSYPGPLGQVLLNFIGNALLHGFSAAGGQMRLTASTPMPGRVLIVFSDNGAGIAPEHLVRIFDPFFTTRMGQGGSGLGLHIAYNIVTSLLNGAIRVDSTPGGGTRFTLDIPLRADTEAS